MSFKQFLENCGYNPVAKNMKRSGSGTHKLKKEKRQQKGKDKSNWKKGMYEQIAASSKEQEQENQKKYAARRRQLKSTSTSMNKDRESEANGEKKELHIEMDAFPLDKKTLTPGQVAKKGHVSFKQISKQLKAGKKIEHEHTSSDKVAREIALDHLGERPDYYVKLKKYVEDSPPSAEQHLKWAFSKQKSEKNKLSHMYRYHMMKASEHSGEMAKHPEGSVPHKLHKTQAEFHTLRAKGYIKDRTTASAKIPRRRK